MVEIITLNPIGPYKVYFVIHFYFEAHFLPENFSKEEGLISPTLIIIFSLIKIPTKGWSTKIVNG